MNAYEEASITAFTYALNFSHFVDKNESLKGQIASFKQSLMSDLFGTECGKENLETVLTQVSALTEEIRDATSFGKHQH